MAGLNLITWFLESKNLVKLCPTEMGKRDKFKYSFPGSKTWKLLVIICQSPLEIKEAKNFMA